MSPSGGIRNLHRTLAVSLILGGMAIALVLGGGVLLNDLEAMEDTIVALGVDEANRLAPALPADLDGLNEGGRKAVDALLDDFIAARARSGDGHFVIAELYDLGRRSVAEGVAPDKTAIETAIDVTVHHFPDKGDTWYAKHLVGGQVFLQVVSALHDRDGRAIGWFEGVYHIPSASLWAIGRTGLKTSLLVIAAVLATTGLLYPLIASLNAGLITRSRALLAANLGTLELLGSAIAKRDSDTNAHNYRVTLYAVRLAEQVGIQPERIRALIKGAFLHDVGKIAIPDAILLKPGKLNDDEFTVMRTHVAHGLDIVDHFDWLKDATEVVGGHHERYDGTGYPTGTKGEAIPLTARIFAIADVFDALTSRRPYKEPFPLDKALAILTESASRHFDPALLDAFIAIAPALHAALGGREDNGVQEELQTVTRRYFAD